MKRVWIPTLELLLGLWLGACSSSLNVSGLPSRSPTSVPSLTPPASPLALIPSSSPTPLSPPTFSPEPTLATFSPLPTRTQTPTPLACWQEGGVIEQKRLKTDLLPLPLSFRVYTPPCYDQGQQRHYPVLYLIHGRTYTDDQWDRLGADDAADALIAEGQISPFIIVMPRDRSWIKPPKNRFGEALIDELVPWIDAHYRTVPNRTSRAIGGLSWGGNWAVRLGLTQWRLFGAIGVHSAPTFDIDNPPRIRAWLEDIPPQELPRFFMDSGKNDYHLSEIMQLENTLNDAGVPHEWHLYPGYHEEAYWSAHVEEYIRWYAQEW